MSITIQFESEETSHSIPWNQQYTMGDLLEEVILRMAEKGEEDFNCERVAFYDREYRKMRYDYDDQPVEEGCFVRVMIMNENLVGFYFQGPQEKIVTWPWIMDEESEAWLERERRYREEREPGQED